MKVTKILISILIISLRMAAQDEPDTTWLNVQEKVRDTVVHIIAQEGEFNWLQPYETRKQTESSGSGFFINAQGELLTNAHLVQDAKRIWIHIPSLGKKPLTVSVIGIAPDRDVALLRLADDDKKMVEHVLGKIPFLPLGNSDAVRRTDKVLLLGYPLGQYHLKSGTGIVSGREFMDSQSYIQTTAPINQGNSGGPLLNTHGEVIGINTAAISSAQNVGYAIPINEIANVLDVLYTTSLLRNPWLGVQYNNSSDFHAQVLGNPEPGGLYINKVYKGQLADKYGVKAGDMLYKFNEYVLDVYGEAQVPWSEDRVSLQDLIARLSIGAPVSLTLYRQGKIVQVEFPLELILYPVRRQFPDYELVDYETIGGVVVMQAVENNIKLLEQGKPILARYSLIENRLQPALIITNIFPGSQAKKVRSLDEGDILESVNGVKVRTLDEFRQALKKGVPTKSLEIKTDEGVVAMLPLERILAEESDLAKALGYPLSPMIKMLQEMMDNGTEKKTRHARAGAPATV